MDEFTKRKLKQEISNRKKEDEIFNAMMQSRLDRQFKFSNIHKHRDSSMVIELDEEDSNDDIYIVSQDPKGEFEVEKKKEKE